MTKYRIVLAAVALIGAVLGAALGFLLAPTAHRYKASANVGLLPAASLTPADASAFWEVLTRGQISRTAAVLYNDPRWLPSAANAAKVSPDELSVTASALPDTTMLTVTAEANSAAAAESALNDVLATATPEVTSLSNPFAVKVLWPAQASAVSVPVPSSLQVAAAGGLGGALVCVGIGWIVLRSRRTSGGLARAPVDSTDGEWLAQQ
jgi:capsular polysaccharide biosynthesis protein